MLEHNNINRIEVIIEFHIPLGYTYINNFKFPRNWSFFAINKNQENNNRYMWHSTHGGGDSGDRQSQYTDVNNNTYAHSMQHTHNTNTRVKSQGHQHRSNHSSTYSWKRSLHS